MLRSVFAIFTALLLGATLTAPVVLAVECDQTPSQALAPLLDDSSALPMLDLDTDSEDADSSSAAVIQTDTPVLLKVSAPLVFIKPRVSERPPARASPL